MALVSVMDVHVPNNPAKFLSPFTFEITFDCLPPGIKGELEWKLIYVGSAEDEQYDQELDSVLVGPVSIGRNKFLFEAPSPNPALIPKRDLLEVTVLLLTCSYREHEFIRIGYYVNNEEAEDDNNTPPQHLFQNQQEIPQQQQQPQQDNNSLNNNNHNNNGSNDSPEEVVAREIDIKRVWRNILSDKPRVTRFQIPWDNETLTSVPESLRHLSEAERAQLADQQRQNLLLEQQLANSTLFQPHNTNISKSTTNTNHNTSSGNNSNGVILPGNNDDEMDGENNEEEEEEEEEEDVDGEIDIEEESMAEDEEEDTTASEPLQGTTA